MPWSKSNLPPSVETLSKKEDWSDAQIDAFVSTANAMLEKGEDEGVAIATGIKQARHKENSVRFSVEDAKRIGKELGCTFARFSPEDLVEGMNHELEHGTSAGNLDETHDNPDETAKIALVHLYEDPEYYKKLETMEKTNATTFPEVFYCRHMQPGVAGYMDETILVDTDCMKKMSPSFIGKPVYVHHQAVDLDNLKEEAVGYVTDCFYNEMDGWLWAKFIAIDDAAKKVISENWAVSNAYMPLAWTGPGTKQNVEYNRAITDAEFSHLALVPNPRYEDAKIYTPEEFKAYQARLKEQLNELTNSKTPTPKTEMLPMKKGFQAAVEAFAQSLSGLVTSAISEVHNDDDATPCMNDDGTTDIDGKKVSLKELVNTYKAAKRKKNDDDDSDDSDDSKTRKNTDDEDADDVGNAKSKKNDDDDSDDSMSKKNDDESDDDESAKTKDNSKDDPKFFEELRNADRAPVLNATETVFGQLARGKSRYGSN